MFGAAAGAVLALGLSACGDQSATTAQAPDAAHDAGHDAAADPDSLRIAAPPGASVFFVNLADGDRVSSPVIIRFGVSGIDVVEAGDQTPGTGHHHLLVNVTLDDLDLEWPIPTDDQHLHYGQAQTEAVVELPAGINTLQLVMGDWTHIPHDPPVASEVITVIVE